MLAAPRQSPVELQPFAYLRWWSPATMRREGRRTTASLARGPSIRATVSRKKRGSSPRVPHMRD